MEGNIGEIRWFSGNYAPLNWMICNGDLLPISDHKDLFNIISNAYGGNGTDNFALPNFIGRTAVGSAPGNAPGFQGGQETNTIAAKNMPSHTHTATLHAINTNGTSPSPSGQMLAKDPLSFAPSNPASNKLMSSQSIMVGQAGYMQPYSIMQPGIGINFIICVTGTVPKPKS